MEYKQANLLARSSVDIFKGPTLSGDVVAAAEGFLAGAEAAYDIADAKVTRFGVGLGYSNADYSLGLLAYFIPPFT